MPGNHNSAILKLNGHVDYCFRVSGVNAVGRGPSSQPTERYRTPPAGLRHPLVVYSTFLLRYDYCQTLNITDSSCEPLLSEVSLQDIVSTRQCQLNPYSVFFLAPDKNPENIKIESHLPHEMDINWEVRHTICPFIFPKMLVLLGRLSSWLIYGNWGLSALFSSYLWERKSKERKKTECGSLKFHCQIHLGTQILPTFRFTSVSFAPEIVSFLLCWSWWCCFCGWLLDKVTPAKAQILYLGCLGSLCVSEELRSQTMSIVLLFYEIAACQLQFSRPACHSNPSEAVTLSSEIQKAPYTTVLFQWFLFVCFSFFFFHFPLFSHYYPSSTMDQVWSTRWATEDRMWKRTGRSTLLKDTHSWWRTLRPLCPMRLRSRLGTIRDGVPSLELQLDTPERTVSSRFFLLFIFFLICFKL